MKGFVGTFIMEIMLIGGTVACGWLFLSVLSGERRQQLVVRRAELAALTATAKSGTANASASTGHGEKLTTGGEKSKVKSAGKSK